jgi:hypothetical protein
MFFIRKFVCSLFHTDYRYTFQGNPYTGASYTRTCMQCGIETKGNLGKQPNSTKN